MPILDYLFLAVAAFLAATLSGAAGFGGALVLLPLLTNVVGVKAAVPILTIAQLFGNGSRVWFGRQMLRWKPILYFLAGALPLTLLGSYFFSDANSRYLTKGVGVLLLLIVIYRRLNIRKIKATDSGMALGGGLTGFLSGLAGSAGPLGAAFFLGLNLPAVAYTASEAFTALVIHLLKTLMYRKYALVGSQELLLGLGIGLPMILGSWAGKRLIERLPRE